MTRQKQLLVVLAVLFALSLIYAWFRTPRQQTVAPGTVTAPTPRPRPAPASPTPAAAATTPPAYRPLALPEPEQREVVVKRNLFMPLQLFEARQAAKQTAAVKPPPPPPPPPPPTPQELARVELGQYKLLGHLKKQGRLVVFLTRGNQIRLVRVGDTLIAGYSITSITDDRLLMRSAEGDELSLGLR